MSQNPSQIVIQMLQIYMFNLHNFGSNANLFPVKSQTNFVGIETSDGEACCRGIRHYSTIIVHSNQDFNREVLLSFTRVGKFYFAYLRHKSNIVTKVGRGLRASILKGSDRYSGIFHAFFEQKRTTLRGAESEDRYSNALTTKFRRSTTPNFRSPTIDLATKLD